MSPRSHAILASAVLWAGGVTCPPGLAQPEFESARFLTRVNHYSGTIDFTSDPGGNAVIAFVDRPALEGSSLRNHVVAKISASGDALWSYRLLPHVKGIATDPEGSVYVAGVRLGPGSDPIRSDYFKSVGITPDGEGTGYVAKLSSEGVLQWVRQFGGSAPTNTLANAVVFDRNGDYYVVGQHKAGTVLAGRELPAPASGWGVYVAKFAPDGQAIWAHTGSGSSVNLNLVANVVRSHGFNLDRHGNLNVRFQRWAPDFDESGTVGAGAYFVKFDPDGRLLLSLPTPEEGPGTSDQDGNLFTACYLTESGNQGGAIYQEPGILRVRKHAATGELVWTREAAATPQYNNAWSDHRIITDRAGNCLIAGWFDVFNNRDAEQFEPGEMKFGSVTLATVGFSDAFIVRFSAAGELHWALQSVGQAAAFYGAGTGSDISSVRGFLIAPAPGGEILFTGNQTGTVAFDDVMLQGPALYEGQPQFIGRLVMKAAALAALSVSREGDEIVLSWPATEIGVALEAAEALLGAAWTAVPDQPVTDAGRSVLRLRMNAAARFYRLARP